MARHAGARLVVAGQSVRSPMCSTVPTTVTFTDASPGGARQSAAITSGAEIEYPLDAEFVMEPGGGPYIMSYQGAGSITIWRFFAEPR